MFENRGDFLEKEHFNKHFILTHERKHRAGKNILNYHCVKSVLIRSFSGPYFPAFGLYTERYGVNVLKLFLFLEEFQCQCSYKIDLIKITLTWDNSFCAQRTASESCCTKTSPSTFFRSLV